MDIAEGGFMLGAVGRAVPVEPADFAAWVSPHLAVLHAVAVREVGATDADDIVQDALVRAWRRRSTFDPARGSVRAWLVAVLIDQARRHRARHRRRIVAAVDQGVDQGTAPASRVDVERAVRELPRRQREVVVLHYLADLAISEVSQVLQISEGSVKSHLFAARASLREQ